MSPLRIGLIGVGSRLQGLCHQLRSASTDLEFVAAYDPDPGAIALLRQTLEPDLEVYTSAEAMVSHAPLDWVLIGSYNAFHRAHAVASLQAGRHVFCEKPLATTLEDCLAIREAWKTSGRHFAIGFTLRYSLHYRLIKDLVRDGAVGDILSLEFNETLDFNHGGFIHSDWRRFTRLAGSHVLEKCCHDLDIVNDLLESRLKRVASFGGCRFFVPKNAHHIRRLATDAQGRPAYGTWSSTYRLSDTLVGENNPFTTDKDIVDHQVAILEFENGVRATFHTNAHSAFPERRLLILGSEGAIRADFARGKIEVARIGFENTVAEYDTRTEGGHGGGDQHMVSALVSTMLEGRPPSPGLEDGLTSAVVAFGIDAALETGAVVEMAPYWARVDA